jgi:hypothetical protein
MAKQTTPCQAGHRKQCVKTERRAWVRLAGSQKVSCKPVAGLTTKESELRWSGTIRDVSRGGIGLILSRRFEPGTLLILELASAGKESRHLALRVVHARAERKGDWTVGCAFVCPISEEDLQTILRE